MRPIDVLSSALAPEFILGLDAEVTVKDLWPHTAGCPQIRDFSRWKDPDFNLFDWHGDGFAFELCIEPIHCLDAVLSRVACGLYYLHNQVNGKDFWAPTLYRVPDKIVREAPEEVQRLGCAPSFNIHNNPGIPEKLGRGIRTTGCHLHISSLRFTSDEIVKLAVRWADVIVGNSWNYISPELPEEEAERRLAYGRAGEHRRNIYPNGYNGFEYRVLPGAVLHHPVYLTLMFNLLRHACFHAFDKLIPPEALLELSMKAINEANKSLSLEVLKSLSLSNSSFSLLQYLREHKLPKLSASNWSQMGLSGQGHQYFYHHEVLKGGN